MRIFSATLLTLLLTVSISFAQDAPQLDATTPPAASSGGKKVTLILTRGRSLEGELNLDTVSATTNFGSAEFPITKIDGVKLHSDEKDSCIFAFKNGDLVTGQISIESILVTTDWGQARVNVASIETIKLNPKGEFFKDSTGDATRWSYGETREVRRADTNRANQTGRPSPVRANTNGFGR